MLQIILAALLALLLVGIIYVISDEMHDEDY